MIASVLSGFLLVSAIQTGLSDRLPDRGELVRGRMASLAGSLQVLHGFAADSDTFAAPGNAAAIRSAIAALAVDADALVQEGREREPIYSVSARVLAEHLSRVRVTFDSGRIERARRLAQGTTRACISCHAQQRSAPGKLVVAQAEAAAGTVERGDLHFATRRFDDAAAAYRAVVLGQQWGAEAARQRRDFERALHRLLLVDLRVRGDFTDARQVLASVRVTPGLPADLAVRLEAWSAALVASDVAPAFDPATARADVVLGWAAPRCGPAIGQGGPEWGLAGAVPMLVATGVLSTWLANHPIGSEAPQALGALARCEIRLGRNFEVPLGDLYLQQCVQLAPHSEQGRICQRELELHLTEQRGEAPSPVDLARLAALRRLAD